MPIQRAGVCPARDGVGVSDPIKNFVYFLKVFFEECFLKSIF